jgi:hypothetical protein
MTLATQLELNGGDRARIDSALENAFASGMSVQAEYGCLSRRSGVLVVPVRPSEYPQDMWGFTETLAGVEIALSDSGLLVRLTPAVRQKMIVVASVPGKGAIALETQDGKEYEDLAGLLGVGVQGLSGTSIEGYAFDSDQERLEVVEEARADYPHADFSKVA